MTDPRRPTAFRLDEATLLDIDEAPPVGATGIVIEPEEDAVLPPEVRRRRPPWGKILALALGGLASLGLGLAVDALIADLFSRAEWLGWVGLGLAAVAAVALVALVGREVAAVLRLKRIDGLRAAAAEAARLDDRRRAEAVAADLAALFRSRPETARGRAAMQAHLAEIIDGRDLLVLAEREILAPLDVRAQALVVASARRVSLVTALSPRALVDLLYVVAEAAALVRRIAALYGGRPGTLGFLTLMRAVIGHLAVTGGMAAGDSLLNEVVGRSLASRISARLGEGVVNGLMTSRVGLAAIDVCRPLPFLALARPTVSDVAGKALNAIELADRKNSKAGDSGKT